MKYVTYKNDDLMTAKSIIIKNRLYVAGWCLREDIEVFNPKDDRHFAIIAFDKDVPVGCCIFITHRETEFFVRKRYRRMGVGTAMSKVAKKLHSKKNTCIKCGEGIKGSLQFFNKIGFNNVF